jgi:hypothetical protein
MPIDAVSSARRTFAVAPASTEAIPQAVLDAAAKLFQEARSRGHARTYPPEITPQREDGVIVSYAVSVKTMVANPSTEYAGTQYWATYTPTGEQLGTTVVWDWAIRI